MKIKTTTTALGFLILFTACNSEVSSKSNATRETSSKKLSIDTNIELYQAYKQLDTQSAIQKRKSQKKNHQLHQSDARAREIMKFVVSFENICKDVYGLSISPSQKLCKLNETTIFQMINGFDGEKRKLKSMSESKPQEKTAKGLRRQLKEVCVALKMLTSPREYQKQLKKSRQ